MGTITLKNVPPAIHRSLKVRAKAHGRSLNKEILSTLEQSLQSRPLDTEQLKEHARTVRESMSVYLTQKDLEDQKLSGRR